MCSYLNLSFARKKGEQSESRPHKCELQMEFYCQLAKQIYYLKENNLILQITRMHRSCIWLCKKIVGHFISLLYLHRLWSKPSTEVHHLA